MNNQDKGGFSFDDKGGGGGRGGKGGRDGGRGDGKGRRDRDSKSSGAGYRVVVELATLEKALSKKDFVAQKTPVLEVLKAVRPLHLKRIEDLDSKARGALITTLFRVTRQAKPAAGAPSEAALADAAPAAEGAAPEAPAALAPAADAPAADASAADAPAADAPAADGPAADAPTAAPVEAGPAEAAAAPAAAAAAADPAEAYAEVMFNVGLIWKFVGSEDRAATAFELAGKQPSEADLQAPPRTERPSGSDKFGSKGSGPRKGGREGRDGPPRGERTARPERRERPTQFVSSGDWQKDVATLETSGRTRDAARIHEKNLSWADATRLYEAGGDSRSALRCAAMGKLPAFDALAAKLPPEEVKKSLERAQAWEKLMEFHVARQEFDAVAALYERAHQHDQAALAWERAGKLSAARRAYERAKDFVAANRVRDLEVEKLIERGDRLGAATILVTVGRTKDAVETVKVLPGPKAFHFLQKIKLHDEAKALADEELKKAEAEGNHPNRARWLELLGKHVEAAEAYVLGNRKDRAVAAYEQAQRWALAAELAEQVGLLDKAQALFTKANDAANAARVAALPRPVAPPKPEVPPPAEAAEPTPAAEA